jgi:serine phosphatase RsbU (regulator of sigma subunit)
MKKYITRFVFLFYIFFIQNIDSKEIHIDTNFKKENLVNFAEILIDRENLSWEDIYTNSKFIKPTVKNFNFGYTDATIWLRFSLKNITTTPIELIHEFSFPRIDYCEIFILQNGKLINQKIFGDTFEFSKREINDSNFAFNLKLEPNTSYEFYIKSKNKYNISNLENILYSHLEYIEEINFRKVNYGMLYGFLLIMVLFHINLFLSLKDKVYIYFSILILLLGIFISSLHGTNYQFLFPNFPWLQNHDNSVIGFTLAIFGLLFARRYLDFKLHTPRIFFFSTYLIYYFIISNIIISFYLTDKFPALAFRIIIYSIFFVLLFLSVITIYLNFKKVRASYFYSASWLLTIFFTALRLFSLLVDVSYFWFQIFYIGYHFSIAITLVLLALGLADKINQLKKELLEANNILEEKVEFRTRELQLSFDLIQSLKQKQDGDYFLTSLLIEPLCQNRANDISFDIEFFISQKKKFTYKLWNREIGGDISISSNLYLNYNKYIAVINADAMGKSIQGAAGALILGAVFSSIIERANRENLSFGPKEWIINSMLELQAVFESFDFSMLVSAVLVLIDTKNKILYYVNAEHPPIILYRDAKANFLDTNLQLSKLGTKNRNSRIQVSEFQLVNSDILFIGSDGKDDLYITKEDSTEKIMESDENLILENIDKTRNLDEIFELIQAKGELIDDLSIIKISCK